MPCRSVSTGAYKLWVYTDALTQRYGVCKASNRVMADHFGVFLASEERPPRMQSNPVRKKSNRYLQTGEKRRSTTARSFVSSCL